MSTLCQNMEMDTKLSGPTDFRSYLYATRLIKSKLSTLGPIKLSYFLKNRLCIVMVLPNYGVR